MASENAEATETTDLSSKLLEIAVRENRYFPTQIFTWQLDESTYQSLNKRLLELIYSNRKADAEGLHRSNFPALGGWHSKNNLHRKSEYSQIVQLTEAMGQEVSKVNAYDSSFELKICAMWSIINQTGSSNGAHIHPGSLWSGVYYVHAPENSGKIEFIDPRTANIMRPAAHRQGHSKPQQCWSKVNFEPIAGKFLVFPSWLYHAVAPNLSTAKGPAGDRVVVSFNYVQAPASGSSASSETKRDG